MTAPPVRRASPEGEDWAAVRALLRSSFAYMEARTGRASPVGALSAGDLRRSATDATVLLVGPRGSPAACLFARPSRDAPASLYVGRLAVAEAHRGRGFARLLIDAAAAEAQGRGLVALTLDTAATLTELHAAFARLGFSPVASGVADVARFIRSLPATPRRTDPDGEDWTAILRLVRDAFAFMDGRIDPPSSVHRLTAAALATSARQGAGFALGPSGDPAAFLQAALRPDALYLSKIAVAAPHRGFGLARKLVAAAEEEARARGLPALELQSRVELDGNHTAWAALGFRRTGETAHEGYDRPTSLTFRKEIS